MKKILSALLAVSVLSALSTSSAFAGSSFEWDESGEGAVVWEFGQNSTYDTTIRSGSEFNFGGGAGANGEGTAQGQWSGVGAVFGEYGYGTGDAYSNTLGGNYAQAEYHAGSGALAGGFAADANFNGNKSKMKFDTIITNGGAGSAETGLTYGVDVAWTQGGSWTGSYDLGGDGSCSGSIC